MQAVDSPESLCHTYGFRQGLGTSAPVLRVHSRVVACREVGSCAHKQCMSRHVAHREAIIKLLDGPVDCASYVPSAGLGRAWVYQLRCSGHRRVVACREVGRFAHKPCVSSHVAHREAIIDLLDGPIDCAPVICAICNVDVLAAVAQAMCVWHPFNDARLLCQWHNSKPGHKVTCSALVLQR